MNLTLADCCIALTFCQLEGVEAVYVTVEGHEIPYRQSQLLRGEDVLLSGAEEEPVYIQAELWYPKADGSGLGTESRQVRKTEDATLPQAVLSAWLEGPSSEALEACLPEGAQVHELTVTDGVCTVNLSAGFARTRPPTRRRSAGWSTRWSTRWEDWSRSTRCACWRRGKRWTRWAACRWSSPSYRIPVWNGIDKPGPDV